MKYADLTKEQLLAKIESLEMLSHQLLLEKEQETRLEYAWTGNLGHWYWNVKTDEVTFNPLKTAALGYGSHDIPEHVTYRFFTDLLHPEDLETAMEAMRGHLYGKTDVYEVEYRIRAKDGTYKWYYDRGRITLRDENGKPAFLAGIVFGITQKKKAQLELEQSNRMLSEISALEGLTGVGNHRTLMQRLEAETAEAMRTGSPLSVASFVVVDFKKVNDSKGHVVGDQVLVGVASAIRASVRDTDHVGRYGGEEFLVIFPNTTLSAAWKVAERIRQTVAGRAFADGIGVTVSGGVVRYNGETVTELVQLADAHLYRAKGDGKNRIMVSV